VTQTIEDHWERLSPTDPVNHNGVNTGPAKGRRRGSARGHNDAVHRKTPGGRGVIEFWY